LDAAELDDILIDLERAEVRLEMPKVRLDGALKVKNALMQLGLADAFGDADFSGMDGTRELFIDEVYYGELVSVDEAGTEAAGSTAVVMRRKGGSVEHGIIVDRPFLLLLRDLETGAILCLGHVVNPVA
jgi:serine protease inhibitor